MLFSMQATLPRIGDKLWRSWRSADSTAVTLLLTSCLRVVWQSLAGAAASTGWERQRAPRPAGTRSCHGAEAGGGRKGGGWSSESAAWQLLAAAPHQVGSRSSGLLAAAQDHQRHTVIGSVLAEAAGPAFTFEVGAADRSAAASNKLLPTLPIQTHIQQIIILFVMTHFHSRNVARCCCCRQQMR